MGRLPRLPLPFFERTEVAGHQSLARDNLAYCDLATDRQQREYDIVREHHAVTISRVERRNSAQSDTLHLVPQKIDVGGWVWVYNTTATICDGPKTDADAKVSRPSSRSTARAPAKSSQLALYPVSYYALTDYLHVLQLIGSDCTAFGIDCTAYLCNVSFRYVRVQV